MYSNDETESNKYIRKNVQHMRALSFDTKRIRNRAKTHTERCFFFFVAASSVCLTHNQLDMVRAHSLASRLCESVWFARSFISVHICVSAPSVVCMCHFVEYMHVESIPLSKLDEAKKGTKGKKHRERQNKWTKKSNATERVRKCENRFTWLWSSSVRVFALKIKNSENFLARLHR